MKKQKTFLPILPLVFLMGWSACSVDADININNDASGTAEVRIHLHQVAVSYMTDMMSSLSVRPAEGATVFDLAAISAAIASRPGMELVAIETEEADNLTLKIRFEDVRILLDPADAPVRLSPDRPVTFSSVDAGRSLELSIHRGNFGYISGLFVLPESPFTVLLPYSERDFMSQNEYLEILEYALEDYLEGLSTADMLTQQNITAVVTAQSAVLAANGGEIIIGKAVFTIPLLEVLTLENPLLYSAEW
ncbi:MAG: hypothetical protein HN368_18660 [Spirochaetales bacterium]|jgi:hypothetical protein|nr:hypothetical protein [Spirochaetales bacterium]